MDLITPLLLAGGLGTRLWPLSRKSYPKQFIQIIDNLSLFQQSVLRLNSSKDLSFNPHITLTNDQFRFIIKKQLQDIKINTGQIVIEPSSKNTAPAILAGSLLAYEKDEEAILLAAPSDHVIPNINDFHLAISMGLKAVKNGKIITFAIKPTHPKLGYGYLELKKISINGVHELKQFVEKPSEAKAKQMLREGNYFWNSGIFLFKAKEMILAFNDYAPNLLKSVRDSVKMAKFDLDFLRLNPESWSKCDNISIDYAIMEKTKNLAAVPFKSKWSDLGDWDTVRKEMKPDKNGVSLSLNANAIDCKDTLLRSESKNQEIFGFGLKDIIAVAMPDAVLVAHKKKSQDVKNVVDILKKKQIQQAEIFFKDYRPWGWFENILSSDYFKVKKIVVYPGAALSLQSHKHRSEHWVVVEGSAKTTLNNKIKILNKGQSIYIPLGAIHRLENKEDKPIILIEVQTGTYLGEDDITRYEDLYART